MGTKCSNLILIFFNEHLHLDIWWWNLCSLQRELLSVNISCKDVLPWKLCPKFGFFLLFIEVHSSLGCKTLISKNIVDHWIDTCNRTGVNYNSDDWSCSLGLFQWLWSSSKWPAGEKWSNHAISCRWNFQKFARANWTLYFRSLFGNTFDFIHRLELIRNSFLQISLQQKIERWKNDQISTNFHVRLRLRCGHCCLLLEILARYRYRHGVSYHRIVIILYIIYRMYILYRTVFSIFSLTVNIW